MGPSKALRFPLWLFAGLFLLAPFTPSQAAPAATLESRLSQAEDLLDAELFKQELTWWAAEERDGREAGTRAADEVAARASWQWAELGLQPLGDRIAGKPSFYQEFPLPKNRLRSVDPTKAHLRLAGKKLEMEVDWALLGGPSRVNLKPVPLVFLGHGNEDRDLVDAGLEGKAAVIWETPRPTTDAAGRAAWVAGLKAQAKRAAEFGAVALLFVPAPGQERALHTLRQDLLGTSGRKIPMVQLSGEAASALLSRIQIAEGAEILATGIPGASLEMAWEATVEPKGKNVSALWPGSDPRLSKEFVVIGAHRDHVGVGHFSSRSPRRSGEVHGGADDNASGSVGVLQLARAFASAGVRPKRSLIFVLFDAEEMNLVGSGYWVANPPVPLEKVVAMFNLDMIGRGESGKCAVLGSDSSPLWPGLLEAAAEGSRISFHAAGGGFGGSDHIPFNSKGIPALFFFTGLHAQYHSADDTADRCDCDAAVEILSVALSMVVAVADGAKRPEFQAAVRSQRPARSNRAQLDGVSLLQTNAGVVIRQVKPGSGAAEAGLKPGDQLVAVDGRAVKRVSEFQAVLRNKTKGQTVALAWRRGAQDMTGTARLK